MTNKRGWLRVLLGVPALMLLTLVGAPAAGAATAHCTGHTTEVKVESDASPATVQVIDTRTGELVSVVVTISGSDITITPVDPTLVLVDASWCIKSSTNTNSGTGLTGSSTSVNKNGSVQAVSYVVLYSVTSEDPNPPQPCNQTTNSGGQGVTETAHELGTAGPTSFLLQWEAFNQPDQFEVFYEGNLIFDTGLVGDNINEGTGSTTVNVPAGSSTQVTVRVTGPEAGTLWEYVVNCPTEA